MSTEAYLVLAAMLFAVGALGFLLRRNALIAFMSVELMLNSANLVFVTFAQGKSALTKEAKAALDEVKAGKHVQIVGTASPEGSKEINDKLSQARADVVAKYLQDKGVVVDEATGKGVQGNTSNRLAVVYVK